MQTIDFKTIISELVSSDRYSHALLAHECECSVQYIQFIHQGKRQTPNYNIGAHLVKLHGGLSA